MKQNLLLFTLLLFTALGCDLTDHVSISSILFFQFKLRDFVWYFFLWPIMEDC